MLNKLIKALKRVIHWKSTNTTKEETTHKVNYSDGDKINDEKMMIKKKELKGTPFQIITLDPGGKNEASFVATGNKRLTEYGSKREMEVKVQLKDWDIIIGLIGEGVRHALEIERERKG